MKLIKFTSNEGSTYIVNPSYFIRLAEYNERGFTKYEAIVAGGGLASSACIAISQKTHHDILEQLKAI